jgi:hypothetical protein
MRNRLTLLFVLTHIAGLSGAAIAQTVDQQRCFAPVIGDDKIDSCTAIIKSDQETPENLAQAFYNRGFAYVDKAYANNLDSASFDRAIEDFDQAIRLSDQAIRINPKPVKPEPKRLGARQPTTSVIRADFGRSTDSRPPESSRRRGCK